MALITCPECGLVNVSDTAAACPNCGFDIRGYFQHLENQRMEEEKHFQEQENLLIMRELEEQEHQRQLNQIPVPTPYSRSSMPLGSVLKEAAAIACLSCLGGR